MAAGLTSYQLARERLSHSYLFLAIDRFYSKPEMLDALKRSGFYMKGVRLESLSRAELADWMTEAFQNQPDFGSRVAARLDEATAPLKSQLAATSAAQFVKAIGSLDRAIEERSLPGPLWALATDPRPEANRALGRLVQKAKGRAKETLNEMERQETEVLEAEELLSGLAQVKRLEDAVVRLAEKTDKEIRRGEKKIQALREKREDQGRRIALLEEERAQLRREKATLENEKTGLAAELERLRHSRPQLERAERRIHELTKEIARLEHEIAEARRLQDEVRSARGRLEAEEQKARQLGVAMEEAEARAEQDRFTYEAVTSDLRAEVARLRARMAKEQERRAAPGRTRSYRDQRVGIFLDVSNLYRAGLDYYRRQIDYPRFTQAILNGRIQAAAIAYNVETAWGDKSAFFEMLRRLGYEVRTKELLVRADGSRKGDWDVGIAADIVERLDRLDVVALGSGDGDFLPVVRRANERGVAVEVYAFPNTAAALKEEADYFPIDENLLQEEISRFARPPDARTRDELLQEIALELDARHGFLRRLSPPELEQLLASLKSRRG